MNKFRIAGLILLLLISGVVIVIGSYFSSTLPDKVPTHFDSNGNPTAYASKETALSIFFGVTIGLGIFLAALGLLLHKIPINYVNIPNKSYWIARPRLLEELLIDYGNSIIWFAVAFETFFIALYGYIFQQSSTGNTLNPSVIMGLTAGLVLSALCLVAFILTKRPE